MLPLRQRRTKTHTSECGNAFFSCWVFVCLQYWPPFECSFSRTHWTKAKPYSKCEGMNVLFINILYVYCVCTFVWKSHSTHVKTRGQSVGSWFPQLFYNISWKGAIDITNVASSPWNSPRSMLKTWMKKNLIKRNLFVVPDDCDPWFHSCLNIWVHCHIFCHLLEVFY